MTQEKILRLVFRQAVLVWGEYKDSNACAVTCCCATQTKKANVCRSVRVKQTPL
mgnify:CR=1 FL=1|nr:MAG TPA: hypothetical protein [Caudoviricetes sp.]